MTLTSQIIIDAYRQANIVAAGATLTTIQQTEALRYLNRFVQGVIGTEIGEDLEPFLIGNNNIQRPSGYPGYESVPSGDWFLPKNQRMILNLVEATTVWLHPMPDDGSRFAVNDVSGNLATYNLTINGNGRNVEGVSQIVLSTNGTNSSWWYRADLGDWVKYATLVAGDTFPFPPEFDDFFITLLAMRLNPSYGLTLDQQSLAIFKRTETQLKARYAQHIPTGSELSLIYFPFTNYPYRWNNWYGDSSAYFNRGVSFW